MNIFYVYIYLDPTKRGDYSYGDYSFEYEPFYVGKGKDKRIRAHLMPSVLNSGNRHKKNKINKILKETSNAPISIIIKNNLSELDAFNLEKLLIALIGRFDLKLGPLTNMTDGGEGVSGRILSEKEKENIRNRLIGRKLSDDHKLKMSLAFSGENHPLYGKSLSDETKKKKSDSMKKWMKENDNPMLGKTHSQEVRKVLSEYRKSHYISRFTYMIQSPDGELFMCDNLDKFCRDHGMYIGIFNKNNPSRGKFKGWKLISKKENDVKISKII